ncbi:hypothetical protein JMJ77_0001070, partial [Colletotrichum scovillei]
MDTARCRPLLENNDDDDDIALPRAVL